MKFQVGSVVIEIDQIGPEQVNIRLKAPGQALRITKDDVVDTRRRRPVYQPSDDPVRDIKMLVAAGFSKKTLAMVVNNVLGIPITGNSLVAKFGEAEAEAMALLDRPIGSDVWAVFIARIKVFEEGEQLAALGLTGKNQLIVLALGDIPPEQFFADMIERGLSPNQVKIGVLSFRASVGAQFQKAFPKAQIALDWSEFIEEASSTDKAGILRSAQAHHDKQAILKAIQMTKAPKELATFLNYDKRLWRALKTTAPIRRLERDLKTKMRSRTIQTKAQRDLVKMMSLVRLQYHWFKIPVDAAQLSNLRYVQEEGGEPFDSEDDGVSDYKVF
jgi:hypothetical protein